MEQHSTPAAQRISSNRSFSVHNASDVDDFLHDELNASQVYKVEARRFITFLGLQDIWQDGHWDPLFENLKEDQTEAQKKKYWLQTTGPEPNQYNPFCDWVEHLIKVITSFTPPPTRAIHFKGLGTTLFLNPPGYADGEIVKGTKTSIKPEGVCVLGSGDGQIGEWFRVLVPIEVKKGSQFPQEKTPHTAQSLPKEKEAVDTSDGLSRSQDLQVPPSASSSRSRSTSKRSRSPAAEEEEPATKRTTRNAHVPYLIQYHNTSAAIPPNSSSAPAVKHTWDDVQLGRYAMETFAAVGDRAYVLGLAVKRPTVTLWYFDRCGAVRSQPLDVKDPKGEGFLVFVKFLAGLLSVGDAALGFIDFGSKKHMRTEMLEDLCNVKIKVPNAEEASLTLEKVLDRRTGLVGRATVVYKAVLTRSDPTSPGETIEDPTSPDPTSPGETVEDETTEAETKRVETQDVVLKFSWQHVNRKPEHEVLEELHKADEKAADYIIKAFYGWEGTTVSSQRSRFGDKDVKPVDDRALRYTVVEYLSPITQLTKPFHIPYIGWSVLQAIKFLYDLKWFHRDISIGNIGFARDLDCGGVIVKLLDFDLSKRIGSNSGDPHWTGTLPFMSIELLENPNAEHRLGFEVEALIWTLLWIVRVYADGKEAHGKEEHPLIDWFSNRSNFKNIASIKDRYLRPRLLGYTNKWYKELEPEMKGLVQKWYKMRQDLENERMENDNPLLLSDRVYGEEGLQNIENWMVDERVGYRWNKPRNSCRCKKHCTET